MDVYSLSKLSKQQLIELSLKKENKGIPLPIAKESVKQLAQQCEDIMIQPPIEFRNNYK